MLDLNLDMVSRASSSASSFCDDEKKRMMMISEDVAGEHHHNLVQEAFSKTQMEDSGTSNSSIIINCEEPPANAGDENSSYQTTSAFIFDIMKKDVAAAAAAAATQHHVIEGHDLYPQPAAPLITRQLFPVAGEAKPMMTTTTPGQWLNLCQAEASSGEQELRAVQQKQQQVRKSRRGPRSKSSQYRGVTFYRRTSRWESHIWDCGKQVYLGGFDTAHAAARAYDRAAIKFRGVDADLNFNLSDYEEDMKQTKNLSKEEFVHILRRQSTGFSRGSSKYRGVTLHKCGRWEARMGQLLGKKAYDKAAIKYNGREAVTNFEPSAYDDEMIVDSSSGGSCHNLDLSLGISKPSNDSNMSNKLENPAYASAGLQRQAPHCVTTAPLRHPPPLAGMHPGLLPNYEARGSEKRVQSVSSPMFTNWAWQVHSNGNVAAMPVLSIAASSGFSSSTSSPSTFLAQHHTNPACSNMSLPSPTTNMSHYYNHRSSN